MGSQFLLKFRHKKGDLSAINGFGLSLPGAVINLDPGFRSTMMVGKPLGYLLDRNSQHCVLLQPVSLKFVKPNLESLEGMTPTTVVSCTLDTPQIV